jgi:hypothetical protein
MGHSATAVHGPGQAQHSHPLLQHGGGGFGGDACLHAWLLMLLTVSCCCY